MTTNEELRAEIERLREENERLERKFQAQLKKRQRDLLLASRWQRRALKAEAQNELG